MTSSKVYGVHMVQCMSNTCYGACFARGTWCVAWTTKDKCLHACKAPMACLYNKQDHEQALKPQPQEKNNKQERKRVLVKREK